MHEVTVGIAGAAGDGLDKSGDTLARTAGRLGLHVYAYNSYQSIIRGGHIWLRVRIGQDKVYSHGDRLTALVALNQDSIERHAGEVDENGYVIFNSDKIKCDPAMVKKGVQIVGLPMAQLTAELAKTHGPLQAIMQNTVAIGALVHLLKLDFAEAAEVLKDTFKHKGDKIVELNVGLLKAGFDHATATKPVATDFKFSKKRRPFCTGNEAIAIAAAASGCKFYSAYPMTPASTILHWMAAHAEDAGVCVKQAEDELAVINMAIGAGLAGVRSMCATAGGGFALMTEAIGLAGITECPVVCVEVQRGGPSTGLPTKTEQGDLNQVFGASQGEFPRLIVHPRDIPDAYETTVEAFHMAEKYQLPVIIMSDLLLSEHPETVEPEVFRHDVTIDRGKQVKEWNPNNGHFKRFTLDTEDGVSPRSVPGVANALYISGSDEHDERGILISDMFTAPPVRRKMVEKRARKVERMLAELPAPKLEGPSDAAVTLVGWGSTYGVIREAAELLTAAGTKTNYLIIKYIAPFHAKEVTEILSKCKKKISVEFNYTSQMARHIRAETGVAMDGHITKYDGEPFEPAYVVERIKEVLSGKDHDLDVTEPEAREIAYHYLRTHFQEKLRPSKLVKAEVKGRKEPVWKVELTSRATGAKEAEMEIGVKSGATYSFAEAK